MQSNLPKILFTIIILSLIQSSQLFSQEIWDTVWQKDVALSITAVNISPDGSLAVAGDGEGLIRAWNIETGALVWDCTVSGQVDELIFSPDGSKLISRGGSLNLLNPNTGSLIWQIYDITFSHCVKFNSDGTKIVFGNANDIRIVNLETQETTGIGETGWVFAVAFSSDDSMVASAGVTSKELILWNANTMQKYWTGEYNYDLRGVDISPDNKKVVAGDVNGYMAVWDVTTGARDWVKSTAGGTFNLFYNPDGSKIVSGGDGWSDVQVWNSNNASLLWTGSHSTHIHSIELRANRNKLLSASLEDTIKVWDFTAGNLLWQEKFKSHQVRFDTSGNTIIAGGITESGTGLVKLWHYEELVQLTSSIPNNDIKAGTTFNISWSYKNVSKINLEYSTDNGSTWTTIADNLTASLGNYTWTIPTVKSSQCKIRISDAENTDTKDESSTLFTIYVPSITLNNPADGDSLRRGTTQTISWTSERVSTVSIYYSTDNGTKWNTIINNIPAADKNYDWQIPLINSSACKIAIVDSSDATVRSENNGTFTIYKPFELTLPSAGTLWEISTLQNITWTSSKTDKIGLEYSTDSGATWTTIISSISANVGYYVWTIPNTPSKNCIIRIYNPENTNEYDESDGSFTIFNRELKLKSPNGSEEYIAGHEFKIIWENEYVNKIKLEYSSDGGTNWNLLANDINAGLDSTTLEIPDISSENCKIKITDVEKTDLFDESDSVFSIYRSSITITNPKGGESWVVGTTNEINWTSSYASDIKIEYSTDNGTNWTEVSGSISAELGKYLWNIPNTASSLCKVRLTDNDNPNVTCKSDSVFSICMPSIIITNLKGSERWIAGTTHEIDWSSPNTSNIKIEYTSDNGASWTEVVKSISAKIGKYFWIVPNITSSLCKIRLTDNDYPSVICESDSVFTIYQPVINITSPAGGETWTGDTQEEITWFSAFVSNVKIELSLDNGGNWKTIIDSTLADAGKYFWTVPDTTSTFCKIRITGLEYPQVTSENENPFTIDHAVGVEDEEDASIPDKFALYQCYPNPFNPATTISYSLPATSFVTLKVYDVIGNEITTLVNEEKARGIYKIEFNASNITSGIYFYRITTNEFTQTKKMIILK